VDFMACVEARTSGLRWGPERVLVSDDIDALVDGGGDDFENGV
jgi:hypothetical protein